MERSFKTEVKALRLGDGAEFRGGGILAALLLSSRPCAPRAVDWADGHCTLRG